MDYKVSVVVPIFNIFPYLEDCINSILEQTYDNIEIVLVDDGSTDDSGRLCEEYSEKYENIIVVHQVNAGLGMARNTGIRNAKGDYICFVDGDDYISKDHVSNLMSRIIQEGTDACYGGYQQQKGEVFIEQKNPLSGLYLDKQRILHEFFPRMCGKLDYHCVDEVPMSVCMSIYSMQILKDNCLLFNSERKLISEDFVFNLDFLEHSNSISVSESCGYFYRNNEGSLTLDLRLPHDSDNDELVKNVDEAVNKYGLNEEHDIGPALYVDPNSELVQKLHESYVQFTNDHEHGPQTIGGGTYAKKMPNCVAFGCEFPGKNHHMHEENELISLDDLLTAAAIYAQSLYNLLKK